MSYGYSSGAPTVTGDLKAKEDAQRDTLIDFGEDKIDFQTSGSVRLQINNDSIKAVSVPFSGSLQGTADKAYSDQMGSTLVGGVFEIDQGLFQNPNSSYNPIFFPSDDSYIERVGVSSVNYFIAPFDGELIKIQVRSTTDLSSKSLTASLHIGSTGDNAYSATATESVAINGLSPNETHTFDFMGLPSSSFSEGDIYGFSLELAGGYAGNETIHFTTVVRYNPYA